MYVSLHSIPGGRRVAGTVLLLGTVSLITDVSAEMVTAVLPLYLVTGLGLSPLQFGFLDGLYTGVSALTRLAGGHLADRSGRHKLVATLGYALSALAKLLLPAAGGAVGGLGAAIAVDRAGKGIRTAPRDALISLSSSPADLGRAFGVHRAMDTAGALAGPLVAFGVLAYTAGSFDAVFVSSFSIAAVGVLFLVMFVPDRPLPRPVTAAAPWTPQFRRMVLTAGLLGLITIGDGFVYLIVSQRADLAPQYFPLLPLATAASFLLLAVPMGRLADRVGRWRVFIGGYVLLGVVYLLLATPAAPVCLLLHGAFYAATDGVLPAAASQFLPVSARARGLAWLTTGQAIGRFGASVALGAIWTFA